MISIITTIYNGENFILQAFGNLEKQSYKNFEWLIIDDGSNDKSREIIEKNILYNKSFEVKLFSKGKIGRAKALNLGLSNASYDYIAILDCDDLWHPNKLELQIRFINNSILIATDSELFTDRVKFRAIQEEIEIKPISVFNSIVLATTVSHSSIIFRKGIFKYDETLKSQLDMDLIFRFLLLKNSKCYILPVTLSFHRIHQDQYFEKLMGKSYNLNSLKLQLKYLISSRYIIYFPIVVLRLFYLQIPKSIRLRIRERIKLSSFAQE